MRKLKEINEMIAYFSKARSDLFNKIPLFFRVFFIFRFLRYELAIALLHYVLGSYNPDFFDFEKCLLKEHDFDIIKFF